MKRIMVLVVAGLLLFGTGLGGGIFWGNRQLVKTQAESRKSIEALRQRFDALQARGTDERQRADQAQRLKYEVEQLLEKSKEELAQKQQAVGSSRQELVTLRKELADLKEKSARESAINEQKVQQLTGQLTRLGNEQKTVVSELEGFRSRQQTFVQQLDRCRIHNRELAGIARDLLEAYENKGVFSALLAKEPVTGLGKVEAERLIEEYDRKVEQNIISQKDR